MASSSESSVLFGEKLRRFSISGGWVSNHVRTRQYCALTTGPLQLKLYASQKSHEKNEAPQQVINLADVLCVCSADYISSTAFICLASQCHICLSCGSEQERDEWIHRLQQAYIDMDLNDPEPICENDGQKARGREGTPYTRAWPCTIVPGTANSSTPLPSPFTFEGKHWMAVGKALLCLLSFDTPSNQVMRIPVTTIRCFGGVGNSRLFVELGRQSRTGEGKLWFKTLNADAANDMKKSMSELISERQESQQDASKQNKRLDRLKNRAALVKDRIGDVTEATAVEPDHHGNKQDRGMVVQVSVDSLPSLPDPGGPVATYLEISGNTTSSPVLNNTQTVIQSSNVSPPTEYAQTSNIALSDNHSLKSVNQTVTGSTIIRKQSTVSSNSVIAVARLSDESRNASNAAPRSIPPEVTGTVARENFMELNFAREKEIAMETDQIVRSGSVNSTSFPGLRLHQDRSVDQSTLGTGQYLASFSDVIMEKTGSDSNCAADELDDECVMMNRSSGSNNGGDAYEVLVMRSESVGASSVFRQRRDTTLSSRGGTSSMGSSAVLHVEGVKISSIVPFLAQELAKAEAELAIKSTMAPSPMLIQAPKLEQRTMVGSSVAVDSPMGGEKFYAVLQIASPENFTQFGGSADEVTPKASPNPANSTNVPVSYAELDFTATQS